MTARDSDLRYFGDSTPNAEPDALTRGAYPAPEHAALDYANVELEVSDNGPGIPPELIDEIFEPFFTTKEPGKGTGLGLAVAAGLVDAMGGTIRVDSPEGRGTSFTVVLPAAPDDRHDGEARTDALAGTRRAGERGEA
jgi:signal transduction histidine kinase